MGRQAAQQQPGRHHSSSQASRQQPGRQHRQQSRQTGRWAGMQAGRQTVELAATSMKKYVCSIKCEQAEICWPCQLNAADEAPETPKTLQGLRIYCLPTRIKRTAVK